MGIVLSLPLAWLIAVFAWWCWSDMPQSPRLAAAGFAAIPPVLAIIILMLPSIRSPAKKNAFKLGFSYLIVLCFLVMIEGLLQWVMYDPDTITQGRLTRQHVGWGFDTIPDATSQHVRRGIFDVTYEIDALSCRRHGEAGADTDGETAPAVNVLAMGGSQTFGWGVEPDQPWPAVLQSILQTNVWNGGVPAFGPQQAYLKSAWLVPKVKPDLIVVGLIEGHLRRLGLDEAWNQQVRTGRKSLPVLEELSDGELGVARFVPSLDPAQVGLGVDPEHTTRDVHPWKFRIGHFVGDVMLRTGYYTDFWINPQKYPPFEHTETAKQQFRLLELVLRGFGELSRELEIPVAIVLLPEPEIHHRENYEPFVRRTKWMARQHGLLFWDIGDDVVAKEISPDLAIHRFAERHYSPEAHQAIANAIADRVRYTFPQLIEN
jgi:hypothetical protein